MNERNSEPYFEPTSRLETVGQLRAQLIDIMPDAETLWHTENSPQSRRIPSVGRTPSVGRRPLMGCGARIPRGSYPAKSPLAFRGHLAMDSNQAYALLRERFATLGYTPLLRRQSGYDVVVAIRHVFPQGSLGRDKLHPRHWVPNVILLLITLVTTTLMGAIMEQGELLMRNPFLFFQKPWLILTGIPASLTIMSILGIHELAHYFVARYHGLATTLPYFIPVPFGLVGTLGAIIRIRTPWENRKALFDVGLAGPLAGFLVALPLFFVGLLLSPHEPPIPGSVPLGSPLLLQWIEQAVILIRDIPKDHEIYVNAMAFSSWFGLVVTGFNLLPVGQLDGGHIAYAVLGRWAKTLGSAVLIGIVVLGILGWKGWLVWTTFILISGWQHPAPLNALDPLGRKRVILGILMFILMILLLTPAPFPTLMPSPD